MHFGIVQGRLIEAPLGQLQWFPQEQWECEFFVAAALGIDFVELIAERHHNPLNPLWTDDGIERIKCVAHQAGLALHAFCNDYVIGHPLLGNMKALEQNLLLIDRGAQLGCDKYILPLFEQSELTLERLSEYVGPLRTIGDSAQAASMTVCLETGLRVDDLLRVMERLDHAAMRVVFDTGNRAAAGYDLPGDIRRLGSLIAHVHIKDKNTVDENVLLGTGLVNFRDVFEALDAVGYNGPYTFETSRGKNPARTAAYNMNVVRFFQLEGSSR